MKILDNNRLTVNEHLWSGIIHRSETGEVRKEDDVNILSKKDFYDYILDHYTFPSDLNKVVHTYTKYAMAFSLAKNLGYSITYYYYDDKDVCAQIYRPTDEGWDLVDFFENNGYEYNDFGTFFRIYLPNGNQDFLKLFDLIVDYFQKHHNGIITKKK